eukprot:symbB.v1.2.016235.t1/scaffold1230.1/size216073/15
MAFGGLWLLLCPICLAKAPVKSGRYLLLNRHYGKYLLEDEALGLPGDALWMVELKEGGAHIENLKTGRLLGGENTWHIHAVCRSSGVNLVNQRHEVLAVEPNLEVVQRAPSQALPQGG